MLWVLIDGQIENANESMWRYAGQRWRGRFDASANSVLVIRPNDCFDTYVPEFLQARLEWHFGAIKVWKLKRDK